MAQGIAVAAVGHHFGKDTGETVGYFDHKRIKVGQTFTIPNEKAFSAKWMERLTEKEAKQVHEEQADLTADAKRTKRSKSVL